MGTVLLLNELSLFYCLFTEIPTRLYILQCHLCHLIHLHIVLDDVFHLFLCNLFVLGTYTQYSVPPLPCPPEYAPVLFLFLAQ